MKYKNILSAIAFATIPFVSSFVKTSLPASSWLPTISLNLSSSMVWVFASSNATIVPFCTSGGSGTGSIDERFRGVCATAAGFRPARLLNGAGQTEVERWVEGL